MVACLPLPTAPFSFSTLCFFELETKGFRSHHVGSSHVPVDEHEQLKGNDQRQLEREEDVD